MVPAHQGRAGRRAGPPASEPVYRPLLAGRRGEFEALRHLDPRTAALLSPVIVLSTVDRSTLDALGRLPAGLVPAVDLRAVPHTPEAEPARWGVPVIPVVGLTEDDHRLVAYGAAARSSAQRAVVRLPADRSWTGPDAATAGLERVCRLTGLLPEQLDLLVDAGDVCCPADVRLAESRVRRVLEWARRHPWRSATVASGAMPPALSGLPTDEPVRVDRWDRVLWRRLADLGVGYADYGITPAGPVDREPGDRLPTVRYTAGDAWWVYRWSRRGGRGDERFADLCRTLVAAPHWAAAGAAFSWGDQEFLRRARRVTGAGSPTNWLAWGTSHHVAQVLAELVAPQRERRAADGWSARHRPPRGTGRPAAPR
ncbi:hypothetical protein AWW66_06885 [Micromonospora rosaria]|uniref:Beta protein n=1 Tax=Micromonospora rosaria TaxID=47874 RepID=A0A136PWH9_9ACTN|nr:beta family protein [Micromonospora rosaria]KXK62762.1 hypothetical protein AWW66_06885 [Micromonospora rosaria]